MRNLMPLSVLIAGIDVATTFDIFLHVDEVEFNNTGDVTINLVLRSTHLGCQLKIDTRSQCNLIPRSTIIAVALGQIVNLILIISFGVFCDLAIVHVSAFVTNKAHITGQVTQVVHYAVNTEIITMNLRVAIRCKTLLVQRQLTHTVDGIFRGISDISHTVLSTLKHQTTTKHTTEVGTLDGVQQTTGIDGAESILFPFCPFCLTLIRISRNRIILFFSNSGFIRRINLITIRMSFFTQIFQLEIGTLTVG